MDDLEDPEDPEETPLNRMYWERVLCREGGGTRKGDSWQRSLE